uniref:PHD finger family protein n=1 Tax=Populus alba TaxID=43335 RepID=A0A4V6A7X3_POPAL|nr:PHD finger family protein [Populus alba]
MVTICQKCGDRGFDAALIYCDECQAYAVHCYCLDALPATFDEYVVWLCYHCESKAVKLSSLDRPNSPISTESDSDSIKIIQLKKKNPSKRLEGKSKEMVFDCSLINSDLLRPQISSDFQLVEVDCCEDDGKDQKLGSQNGLHEDSVPEVAEYLESKNPISPLPDLQLVDADSSQNDEKDQKLGGKNILEEKDQKLGGKTFWRSLDSKRQNLLETKTLNWLYVMFSPFRYIAVRMGGKSSIRVLPIRDPIWRGSMSIFQNNYGAPGGIVAHLSSIACSRASEEAKGLSRLLSPELLPRSGVWPKSFRKLGPAADHIGLYFFPDNERNEIVFDSLVNDMISQDLAMRVVIENAELLIYTSRILPMDCWRFQSKFYLWGVFRPKKPSALASDVVPGEQQGLTKAITRERRSPVSPLSNGSYGSGMMCPSQDS